MKRTGILIVLLGMILCTAGVCAVDGTNETVLNGTDEIANVSEGTDIQTAGLFSAETAESFGKIQYKILMVTEEAFDYLLTGNETQKQAFLDEYATLAEDYAAFEKTIDLDGEQAAEVKEQYDLMVAATDAMGTTAEKMFGSYEVNETIVPEDVFAFEEEVDKATKSLEVVWDIDNASSTEPESVDSIRSWLVSILLEAIEESYAYPVIGEEIEKTDALAKFSEFDEIHAIGKELHPDASFDDLKTLKEDLMKNAETVFATYEADGTVNAGEVAAFENVVESFNDEYVAIVISGIDAVQPVTEESSTANRTEPLGNVTG